MRYLDIARRGDRLEIRPPQRQTEIYHRIQKRQSLHRLVEDREGQWSISVNDQFRICLRWTDHGPEDVEFVDYH